MYRKNSNHDSKNVLESKLLPLADEKKYLRCRGNIEIKSKLNQLTTVPLEHVTPTKKGIFFSFVALTHCSFLFIYLFIYGKKK